MNTSSKKNNFFKWKKDKSTSENETKNKTEEKKEEVILQSSELKQTDKQSNPKINSQKENQQHKKSTSKTNSDSESFDECDWEVYSILKRYEEEEKESDKQLHILYSYSFYHSNK